MRKEPNLKKGVKKKALMSIKEKRAEKRIKQEEKKIKV